MPTFPLAAVPTQAYNKGGLSFGSARANGRKHAACDLVAPEGTEIYACEQGTIAAMPRLFYHGAYWFEFKTVSGKLIRYCEIKQNLAPGLALNSPVAEGQLVAYIKKMNVDAMLHFELYEGTGIGELTVRSNPGFERRSDLIDPTDYLKGCILRSASTSP